MSWLNKFATRIFLLVIILRKIFILLKNTEFYVLHRYIKKIEILFAHSIHQVKWRFNVNVKINYYMLNVIFEMTQKCHKFDDKVSGIFNGNDDQFSILNLNVIENKLRRKRQHIMIQKHMYHVYVLCVKYLSMQN